MHAPPLPLHARFFSALARVSLERPYWMVAACGALLALSAPLAVALYFHLHTDLRELLPEGAPAAVALGALEKRVGGLGHLSVVIETDDLRAGERFVDALAAALGPDVPGQIRRLRYRIDDERTFLDAHGALYAELGDLQRLQRGLASRVSAAKSRANPLLVDLDDEAPAAPKAVAQPLGPDEQAALAKLREAVWSVDRFTDGYLAGENGHTLVMIVTPNDVGLGLDQNRALFDLVDGEVKRLGPQRFHPSLRVGYDGDVREVIEAQEHLIEDIGLAGILVLLAVGAAILVYYRTFAAVPLLVIPLFSGLALSLAISRLVIHYLNPNTAFLGSIIIGNGINAGLILLARYLEERRSGLGVGEALPRALQTTWLATLVASGAAAASYASLGATRFRGFNQFAFMGGIGMLLCWATTYLFMPGFIVLAERVKPLGSSRPAGLLARPLSRLLLRRPLPVLGLCLLVSGGALLLLVRFSSDPIEYDFSRLGSRRGAVDGAAYYSRHLDAVMQSYQTPTVILTESPAQAEAVAAALEAAKRAQGPGSPIDQIRTLARLLPEHQAEKLVVLRQIFEQLTPATLAALPDEWRPLAERLRARTQLREVSLADLPERFTWVFHEKDHSEGKLVLIYPTLQATAKNGRAQLQFARTLRDTATGADPHALVAGGLILSADIVETITADGGFAAALSFAAVVLLTLLLLRSLRHAAWVIGSLCLGTLWMGGALGLVHLKLNFVNFVVLPITFGIGIDYAVNLYQRYRQDGDLGEALAASGGAVALCSSTTIISYATLLVADNQAIYSFGLSAVLGEVTCLGAALIALPAALALRGAKRT